MLIFRTGYFYLIFLLLYSTVCAKNNDYEPQTIFELQSEIEKVVEQTNTPGAVVAIVSRGRTEWQGCFGFADVAARKPIVPSTLFRIGSVSKGFTALALLKLQEEGKLDLNDPLRKWVPIHGVKNPWEATDPVRLVHLLEHTSGVPDMRLNEGAHDDPRPLTTDEALAFAPQHRVIRWRPGSRSAYSNVNAILAAAAVEKATGRNVEDYIHESIFEPLGMRTATYFINAEAEQNLTKMYQGDGKKIIPYTHLICRPAGGVSASIEDMARYVRFYLQRGSLDGDRILSAASIERMEEPKTLPAVNEGITAGYGLFNVSSFWRGHEFHGHNGQTDGCLTTMAYSTELGSGRIIMINSLNGWAIYQIQRLVDNYLTRGKTAVYPPPFALSSKQQKALNGLYANIAPREEGAINGLYYFVELRRVTCDATGMSWQPIFGSSREHWTAVADRLFRRDNATKPTLAIIKGASGESLLQSDRATMKHVSAVGVWSVIFGVVASTAFILTAVIWALVWIPLKLIRRRTTVQFWSVRLMPLLGALIFLGFFFFYVFVPGGEDRLGTVNVWSVGMMLTSIALPLVTLVSVVIVWRHRRSPVNRVAYWHSVLVTLGLAFMSSFLAAWGAIGLRTWI